ncbi:MAG: SH3 domain-containing protein [Pseudomonadota bacterium]
MLWPLALCWAGAAAAFDLPALHRVTGVAADDGLNIRSAPVASADVLGTLPPDSTGIEVTERSANGRWGRINVDEGSGWVALRFLERTGGLTDPVRATCFGMEPFWSLALDGTATFTPAAGAPFAFDLRPQIGSANRTDRLALLGSGPFGDLTATLSAGSCSDGMSDRHYALRIDAVLDFQTGGPRLISGCCTLSP